MCQSPPRWRPDGRSWRVSSGDQRRRRMQHAVTSPVSQRAPIGPVRDGALIRCSDSAIPDLLGQGRDERVAVPCATDAPTLRKSSCRSLSIASRDRRTAGSSRRSSFASTSRRSSGGFTTAMIPQVRASTSPTEEDMMAEMGSRKVAPDIAQIRRAGHVGADPGDRVIGLPLNLGCDGARHCTHGLHVLPDRRPHRRGEHRP